MERYLSTLETLHISLRVRCVLLTFSLLCLWMTYWICSHKVEVLSVCFSDVHHHPSGHSFPGSLVKSPCQPIDDATLGKEATCLNIFSEIRTLNVTGLEMPGSWMRMGPICHRVLPLSWQVIHHFLSVYLVSRSSPLA